MLLDGGFASVDLMMSDPGCTYNSNDIINAINDGRSHLNYRGEGWYEGWYATCYDFWVYQVSSLNNGQKFTFVTSIGCGVANFAAEWGNCFGEEWMETGSISSPAGAAAFIGPTSNTHTTYNNKIDKGIYTGMFQEGLDTPGQGLLRGKLYMYNVFGNSDPFVEYHYKIYCVLGDPSIHIWKDVPLDVTVDYSPTIVLGSNYVEFTVTHTSTGLPVENAIVCVTGNEVFTTGTTEASGAAFFEITTSDPELLTVTITGGNVYPFQGTLEVIPPSGPYVTYDSCAIVDFTGGNGNGIMETSEDINASLTIKNIGITSADNVSVTVSTSDEYITVTDSTESYGSIAVGTSSVIPEGFEWEVADNIPDLHNVIFKMTASDGSENWTSFFNIKSHAPILETGSLTIDDSNGNANGRLDPGETVNLIISTHNNGTFQADGAVGTLDCSSGLLTLNNTIHDFGVIQAGTMEQAIFNATVASNVPLGTDVNLMYEVTSGGYHDQKEFVTTIGLILEDWETGDMTQYNWVSGGSSIWNVTSNFPFEGSYSAQSGDISNNQNTYLSLQYEVLNPDSISFWIYVSSEQYSDYLKFTIDDILMDQWSGEVGWIRKAYAVSAGSHTFKWDYDKSYFYTSGSDCAWVDNIILPISVLQASFSANVTEVCEDGTINFNDQSSPGVTSWNWTFESGTPATSTLQNPVVQYTSPGIYDVSLTVSNGSTSNTFVLDNYITVSVLPETAPTPSGPTAVCGSSGSTSYSTTGLTGISNYDWLLEPSNAGNVVGTGLTSNIIWDYGFTGEVTLKVAGENVCGTGPYSDPVNITIFLPEVTIEPFDMVCVYWDAFELSGGLPEGGEYSGPGVDNGWFDPGIAGLGEHTITYTYVDPNDCENFAIETIWVDPCTGIDDLSDPSGITVFPNPSNGELTVRFDHDAIYIDIKVLNVTNTIVYSELEKDLSERQLNINLSHLSKGIYFIRLKTNQKQKLLRVIIQ